VRYVHTNKRKRVSTWLKGRGESLSYSGVETYGNLFRSESRRKGDYRKKNRGTYIRVRQRSRSLKDAFYDENMLLTNEGGKPQSQRGSGRLWGKKIQVTIIIRRYLRG